MRFCTPTVSKPSSRVLGRVHARQLLLYRLLVENVKLFTEITLLYFTLLYFEGALPTSYSFSSNQQQQFVRAVFSPAAARNRISRLRKVDLSSSLPQ